MVALGATSAAAACCAAALFWTCRAVLAYERANGVKVLFADASAAAKAKPKAKPEAKQPSAVAKAKPKTEEKTPLPPDMRVKDVSYDGDTALTIKLTKRPDMDSARRYISVTPLAEGAIGLRYASSGDVPRIIVTGDFAFRTNVTLTIRRGLQVHGQATGPEAPSALQQDFTYNFRRQDMAPYVLNSRPHHSALPYWRSRVVPAVLFTIARRVPVKRLNRVDFPTLGRPTIATIFAIDISNL